MQRFLIADLQIDDADRHVLSEYGWYVTANGYVGGMTTRDGKQTLLLLHRYLLGEPAGHHVDHIDGNKLNNRRANLRVATYTLNQANRHRLNRNNQSGARGVVFVPRIGAWLARIMIGRQDIKLGWFETKPEAIGARRAAEIQFYGEYCPIPERAKAAA